MQRPIRPGTFQIITAGEDGAAIEFNELHLSDGADGTGGTAVELNELTHLTSQRPGPLMIKFRKIGKFFNPPSHGLGKTKDDLPINELLDPARGNPQIVEIVQFVLRGNRVAAVRARVVTASKMVDQLELGLVAIQPAR